jgi:hypothetical protein
MQFPPLFLTVLVLGAVLMAAAGAVLLAVLFLADKKGSRLW